MPKYIMESVNVALDEMNRLAGLTTEMSASDEDDDIKPPKDKKDLTELFGKKKRTAADLAKVAKSKGKSQAAAYWSKKAAAAKKKPKTQTSVFKKATRLLKKVGKQLGVVKATKKKNPYAGKMRSSENFKLSHKH